MCRYIHNGTKKDPKVIAIDHLLPDPYAQYSSNGGMVKIMHR